MDRLQPLDLSVNKSAKDFLRSQFQDWYAEQVFSQLQEGSDIIPIDLKLTAIKPLSASWLVSFYDYLKNKPNLIRNGFKEAGIIDCLSSI